jgi:hypothetical protein
MAPIPCFPLYRIVADPYNVAERKMLMNSRLRALTLIARTHTPDSFEPVIHSCSQATQVSRLLRSNDRISGEHRY